MITARKVRATAATLGAVMEAYEGCYLASLEDRDATAEIREKGAYAFYAIKDLVKLLMMEMEELAGNMAVCDVIAAASIARNGGVRNG